MAPADDDLETDARDAQALLERFQTSPQARSLKGGGFTGLLSDYLDDYLDVSIVEAEPGDIEEVVFDIFPRKVSVEASEAAAILEELRALFCFLATEGKSNAAACEAVVAQSREAELARELSDPANFGMAKSFLMGGVKAGFDITTDKGLSAWTERINTGFAMEPQATFERGEARAALPRGKKEKRKKARKAAKQARRRQRK